MACAETAARRDDLHGAPQSVATKPSSLLDQAMQVTMQWGPERLRPRKERLLERQPELTDDAMTDLFARCDEIERLAYDLAGSVESRASTREIALSTIAARYPELTPETIDHAFWQGTHYWHHDHG